MKQTFHRVWKRARFMNARKNLGLPFPQTWDPKLPNLEWF